VPQDLCKEDAPIHMYHV